MSTAIAYVLYFAAVYVAVAMLVDKLCPETRDMGRAARIAMLTVMSSGYGVSFAILAAMAVELLT